MTPRTRQAQAEEAGCGATSRLGRDGPGSEPGPLPGHGDVRPGRCGGYRQGVLPPPGADSAIERVAADRGLPETVRRIAEFALDDIQNGADVRPTYRAGPCRQGKHRGG